jgi:hypothetical protein
MSNRALNNVLRHNAYLLIAVLTAVVLLIPLVLMQFTDEVNWGIADFVVMGCLLFGLGSLLVLVSRRVAPKNKVVVSSIIVVLALYLWAELAVGLFFGLGS